jgi:hypothetical protein
MIERRQQAEIALSTAAIGYASIVQVAAEQPEALHEQYIGAVDHLRHVALDYAASCGNLDAAERAELLALRRFRDGVVALRAELATGQADGEPIANAAEHAVETIDAFLLMEGVGPQ